MSVKGVSVVHVEWCINLKSLRQIWISQKQTTISNKICLVLSHSFVPFFSVIASSNNESAIKGLLHWFKSVRTFHILPRNVPSWLNHVQVHHTMFAERLGHVETQFLRVGVNTFIVI
ncbi:hypothetical protein V8G54_025002 [Vigna mungo]|uniref:Uncharacterized protein n=1 Tax=Vigna mungo TaxID=3915 RepID=A0AAQ3N7S9_VIGMU